MLSAAEAVLAVAPQHEAARQARKQAWKAVGMDVTQAVGGRRLVGPVSLKLDGFANGGVRRSSRARSAFDRAIDCRADLGRPIAAACGDSARRRSVRLGTNSKSQRRRPRSKRTDCPIRRTDDSTGRRGANTLHEAPRAQCHGSTGFCQPSQDAAIRRRRAVDGRQLRPRAKPALPHSLPGLAARRCTLSARRSVAMSFGCGDRS